jgi:Zn-dependent oligopeptidase
MAKNPETVEGFLEDLIVRLHEKGEEEVHELAELKQKDLHDPHAELRTWDMAYYQDMQKRELHEVDEAELQKYFPADHVV